MVIQQKHQRILVTGAAGSLGQDLVRYWSDPAYNVEVIGTTSDDFNLTWDAVTLLQTLDAISPDMIVNAAAFTQVDAAESQYDKALQVNAHAPGVLADWVRAHGAYLVHISTDYVFDGTKGAPYLPTDAPNPINRYGESKRLGEQHVLATAPDNAAVIRTSWLYGSGSRNFVPFILQSAQVSSPIRVARDQWGTPTWTQDLCDMIEQARVERLKGIFHGCSLGQTTRYEQAVFLCDCMAASTGFMTPVETDVFGFPAKRPHNTAMVSSFDCARDWKEATEAFMRQQGLLLRHG